MIAILISRLLHDSSAVFFQWNHNELDNPCPPSSDYSVSETPRTLLCEKVKSYFGGDELGKNAPCVVLCHFSKKDRS